MEYNYFFDCVQVGFFLDMGLILVVAWLNGTLLSFSFQPVYCDFPHDLSPLVEFRDS
jgi:hypothetical protein